MMKNMMIDCLSWLLAAMVKFAVIAAIQVAKIVFCFVVLDSVYDIAQAVKTVVRRIINQEVPQEPPQEPAQYYNEPVIEKKQDQEGLLFPSFVKVTATGDRSSSNKSRKKSSKAARWTNNKKNKNKSPSPSQDPTGTAPVKEDLAAAAAHEEKAAPSVSYYHQAHNVPLPAGDDTDLIVHHWAHLVPLPDGDDANLFVKQRKSKRNKKRIDAKIAGMKFTGKRDETEFETEGRSQKRKRGNNSGKLGVARPVSFFDDDDD